MTSLINQAPHVAPVVGGAPSSKAPQLFSETRSQGSARFARRRALWLAAWLVWPTLVQAQAVDLREATEAGNAIIMYLSGTFAAVGIVAAGVAMMMGRQSIAKWAFAGAMVSGLAFAIVRTMWSNMGLEAADVGTF